MALPESVESGREFPLQETKNTPQVENELSEWIQPVKPADEIELPQPITDDQGQVLVTSPSQQQVSLQLPLTKEERETKKLRPTESLDWLRLWCLRLTQLVSGKFFYKT